MNTERPENPEEPEVSEVSEVSEASEVSGAAERAEEPGTSGAAESAEKSEAADSAEEPEVSGTSEAAGHVGEVGEVRAGGDVGDASPGERSGRRRSPMVVLSVAAAVLLVAGGSAYLAASNGPDGRTSAGGSGSGATPPPLVLDTWSQGGTGEIAPGEPDPYGVRYVAAGQLPDGPGSAPVYAPKGQVGKDEVARLAEALGIDGTPVAEGPSWRVGGGKDGSGPTLQVNRDAPGNWTFSRYAPGTDNCRKITVCTQDPGAPAGEPVSVAVAEKAAAPVLKALGQDDSKIDASQIMGAQRVVDADPVVGGLPTNGWTTGLTVDKQGDIIGGHGLLAAPAKGDTYPVLDAKKTLALMNTAHRHGHRMGIGGCATPVPLKNRLEQPCSAASSTPAPEAAAVTVEKAVFGLATQSVAGRQTLVPSWLFEVRGTAARGMSTVTYPAVDPKYLATPSASAPSSEPTSAPRTHDVKVDGYSADGRELNVSFTGGVCSDYKASAKESAGRVTVTVTSKSWPDKICVAMAKMYVQTVRLDAPLDGRKVVATDGRQIPKAKPGALRPQARRPADGH
ncbi:hypothetical protein ACIRU3_34090 [Streptomyces sp. NPDC101151]|uniref:hypothetical protein n=1 Tax=Streptomyces sp. NPDC101151 TaxID=3366115 RepID=UPI0037F70669